MKRLSMIDIKETIRKPLTLRLALFFAFMGGLILLYYPHVNKLIKLAPKSEFSHIAIIPFITLYFILIRRKEIFNAIAFNVSAGLSLCGVAGLIYILALIGNRYINPYDQFCVIILSLWVAWIGGFILLFGYTSIKQYLFPFIFSILVIPMPSIMIEGITYFLQWLSSELSDVVFNIVGMPYLKDGFVFHFNDFSIEVAKECSGIRSSIALVIVGIISAHLFLKTFWKKVLFLLILLPLSAVKNVIRIVTLTVLADKVDMKFLTDSPLHHDGGFVFFFISMGFFVLILWLLARTEKGKK
jgi:exosortase